MYKRDIAVDVKSGETLKLRLSARKIAADGVQPSGNYIHGIVVNKTDNSAIAGVRVDLCKTMLYLTQQLACFEEPDTGSTKIFELPVADYAVIEIKIDYPNSDTDYVKVESKMGEGWICSRSKTNHYALLHDHKVFEGVATTTEKGDYSVEISEARLHRLHFTKEKFLDSESDRVLPPVGSIDIELIAAPDGIRESFIVDRVKNFSGFSYTGTGASYPYSLPGVSIHVAGQPVPKQPGAFYEKHNNCCTFVEGLLVKAWKDALGDKYDWDSARHSQMMVKHDDYYSPVTAIIETGMGVEIDKDKLPPAWTIVQGWKTKWTGGHTFMIVDVHTETQRILTLESNKTYKMNGPGFRMLGNIDDFTDCTPDRDWWKEETLWNWDKFKATYIHRKMAKLKVYDLKWVK